MGRIGHGYGSEWHLMRFLARHRHLFNAAVEQAAGGRMVDWLDYPFGDQRDLYLAEHKGLDFLFEDGHHSLKAKWQRFWPQTGNPPNWDAVGWMHSGLRKELLLVEAKCHERELVSECGAKVAGGLQLILKSLDEAKQAFGAPDDADWLKPHYQYCNRLAVLHFLTSNNVPARLLFVYFTGDSIQGQNCPMSKEEWDYVLQPMYAHIGVPWDAQQARGVIKVFVPVSL